MFFCEHVLFSIRVHPFIADEFFKFLRARLPVTDSALLGGDLTIPPDIGGNSHIPYRFQGSVNRGVNCELLVQEQEIQGLYDGSRPITGFGDEGELVGWTPFT